MIAIVIIKPLTQDFDNLTRMAPSVVSVLENLKPGTVTVVSEP